MLNLEIVTASDKESLSYIESLYLGSFPPDERRPFEQIVAMLREDSVFALRLLCDDGRRVGFISCWQWPDLAYVEHFAVDPAVRGGGYGAAALQRLCAEAGTPVVLEVEKPHDEMSRRRIGFYRRCGFELSEDEEPEDVGPNAERGRGIRLMRLLADSVSISRKHTGEGTVVRLVKLLDASKVAEEDLVSPE